MADINTEMEQRMWGGKKMSLVQGFLKRTRLDYSDSVRPRKKSPKLGTNNNRRARRAGGERGLNMPQQFTCDASVHVCMYCGIWLSSPSCDSRQVLGSRSFCRPSLARSQQFLRKRAWVFGVLRRQVFAFSSRWKTHEIFGPLVSMLWRTAMG